MALARFTLSNDLLDDEPGLQQRYAEDGYLFFTDVLDTLAVARVRDDLMGVLTAQGIVEAGTAEPVATGVGVEAVDDNAMYAVNSYLELCDSDEMRSLLRAVLGEEVFVFRGTNIRYALPRDDLHVTPPHQDHFFVGPNDDFRTVWIPLMEIDESVGGLAVARGSHRAGLRDHIEQEDAESYVFIGRKQKGVPLATVEEEWLTADYEPGQVLVFHSHAVHRALPNRSHLVRLSLDARCQPARTPRTFQARSTMLELRRFRSDVHAVAIEVGLSEPVFERVVAEMMKRGLPAAREAVERVADELDRAVD
ncbi:MAG: 1-deoxypentalenic acid 11beta-hydroxylase [Gaiellales bacterium]|jgi:1-deoxypentalenic acid 11beta-hydroxylase|nr:1-deoxypentalenic acid 11beta-hydroxylase [Gaiellales bacterium]